MHQNDDMNPQDPSEIDFLRELSPTLFDQKLIVDDTPPDGYFDAFPERMLARIENEKAKTSRRNIPSYINFQTLSIAAGLALILALIPFYKSVFDNNTDTTKTLTSGNNFVSETESDVLANYIDTEDLYASVELENPEIIVPQPERDSDAIIDYLMDEGMSDQLYLESINNSEHE